MVVPNCRNRHFFMSTIYYYITIGIFFNIGVTVINSFETRIINNNRQRVQVVGKHYYNTNGKLFVITKNSDAENNILPRTLVVPESMINRRTMFQIGAAATAAVVLSPINNNVVAVATDVPASDMTSLSMINDLQSDDTRSYVQSRSTGSIERDIEYPGTAVQRVKSVHERVEQLVNNNELINKEWEYMRSKLLWAGGLKDLQNVQPGYGYTGHSFNDYNHVDLTCMIDETTFNENDGSVKDIALGNKLGTGIQIASISELGPGGSWSTCAIGCNKDPPQDVAHIQFKSRIAFKLVWIPNNQYTTFVLVDDSGSLLAKGIPSSLIGLPSIRERQMNYQLVKGSKYSIVADRVAAEELNTTV